MNRIDWLDRARGFGIVLVVIGHALGGLIDAGLAEGSPWPRQTFFAVYTFHMPLFFLLSGLLVPQRLERGAKQFLTGLFPTVVLPYFVWSVVQASVIFALGALVNNPSGSLFWTVVSLPWNTVSQFWFLYALFWMHVLTAILLPRIGAEGLILMALFLKALMLIVALPVSAKLVCNHMLFYAFGLLLRPGGLEQIVAGVKRGTPLAMVLSAAGLTIFLTMLALPDFGADLPLAGAESPEIANLSWRFPAMAAAVIGTVASVACAVALRGTIGEALAFLGRMTMPIFVLHVLFIAGSRIVLAKFLHVTSLWLLLPVLIAAGLVGPLIGERMLRPLKLKRWIGF
jgi:fucose 4-O-acetylase-like acetyltransferase